MCIVFSEQFKFILGDAMAAIEPGKDLTCFCMDIMENPKGVDFGVQARKVSSKIFEELGANSLILRQIPDFPNTREAHRYSVYTLSSFSTSDELQECIVKQQTSAQFQEWFANTSEKAKEQGVDYLFKRAIYHTVPGYGLPYLFTNEKLKRYYLIISVEHNLSDDPKALGMCIAAWEKIKTAGFKPGTIQQRWTGKPPFNEPPHIQWSIGNKSRQVLEKISTQLTTLLDDESFQLRAFQLRAFEHVKYYSPPEAYMETFSVMTPFAVSYLTGEPEKCLLLATSTIKFVVQHEGKPILEGGSAELSAYSLKNLFPIFHQIKSCDRSIGDYLDGRNTEYRGSNHISVMYRSIYGTPQVKLRSWIDKAERQDYVVFGTEKGDDGVLRISSVFHNVTSRWN